MAGVKVLMLRFLSGHERTVRAKKNILALFAVHGYSIVINLALIPLTLHLLDEYKYGVWITLFNVISWISIFDIGIGNGLRNKFTECMAQGKIQEAREYVSTGYVVMSGIAVSLILLFIVPWHFIDWARVFNVKLELASEIRLLVGIAFVLTSIQFCLKLLGTILTASHKPAVSALIMSISNTLVLLIFIIGKRWLADSLIGIGLVYTLTPILVFIIASIILFAKRLYHVRPSFRFFRRDKVKSLFNLGIQFFIIQIAVLVIFQTDALIIAHTLSPDEVTSYNIVFRYFGVVSMLAGIIMSPLWSAYTEAAAKNDFIWIKQVINKLLKGLSLVFILLLILYILAPTIIPLWLNYQLELSNVLLLGMAVYTFIAVYNNIFSFLLNGLSITNVQMITSIAGTIINIPLSIYLANRFGNGGVILATIVSLSFFAIFGSIQAFKVLKTNK
jgi:O-antigen/teichoic acid export membrane protein